MGVICSTCGKDCDKKNQDNMSDDPRYGLCEDCNNIGIKPSVIFNDDGCPDDCSLCSGGCVYDY